MRLFGKDCSNDFVNIDKLGARVLAVANPDLILRDLSRGKLVADAILLDVNFGTSAPETFDLADPPRLGEASWTQENWGHAILKTIKRIDPDLPVIMLSVIKKADAGFHAGRFGAEDYYYKDTLEMALEDSEVAQNFQGRIERAIEYCQRRAIYDHEHLRTIDGFAAQYDVQERGKCATSAYYRFENAFIDRVLSGLVKSAPNSRRIRVLDIGCGTGRIEEFLCKNADRTYDLGKIDIVGVDFSGRTLDIAYEKLKERPECHVELGRNCEAADDHRLHVSLFRAPAESLQFLTERYPDKFDFAIMAFGLLSYVRYKEVLPSEVHGTQSGLVPLLNIGAKVLFSVYNEQSAIYGRIRALPSGEAERDLPIAALMNLATGKLRVCESRVIACEAFSCERFVRLLRQAGLSVDPDEVMTFPTIHLALQNSLVMSGDSAVRIPGFEDDPILPPGRYSRSLIRLDAELSRTLKDKGHYILGLATRRSPRTSGFGGADAQ